MRTVHVGPLTVLPGVAAAGAARGRGRRWAWPRSPPAPCSPWLLSACSSTGCAGGPRPARPANTVTLVRAALVVGVAALVVQSWSTPVPRALLVALGAVALALDFVDGRLARARGTVRPWARRSTWRPTPS